MCVCIRSDVSEKPYCIQCSTWWIMHYLGWSLKCSAVPPICVAFFNTEKRLSSSLDGFKRPYRARHVEQFKRPVFRAKGREFWIITTRERKLLGDPTLYFIEKTFPLCGIEAVREHSSLEYLCQIKHKTQQKDGACTMHGGSWHPLGSVPVSFLLTSLPRFQ